MRCIEHLLHNARWIKSLFQLRYAGASLPGAGPTIRSPIVALDAARWIANISPRGRRRSRMMPRCWRKSCVNSRRKRCFYLGALPGCPSVFRLREQGSAPHGRRSAGEFLMYANSYEREAAAQLFENGWKRIYAAGALYEPFTALLQGVMDVQRDGKLPSVWRLRPSAIMSCWIFCNARYWRWRSVIVMSRNACWNCAGKS